MTRALPSLALVILSCAAPADEAQDLTGLTDTPNLADATDLTDTGPAPSPCDVGQSTRPAPELALVDAFPGLTFDAPMALAHPNDGSPRLFIAERAGRIQVVDGPEKTLALDLSAEVHTGFECGLLGLALHPRYTENGRLFVNYCTKLDGATHSIIAEFRAPDPALPRLDPASKRVLLTLRQPWDNHNGGALAFGPDGHLYAAFGDGGSGNDPLDSGQDKDSLLGKILRLDVRTFPYAIPADNPYARGGGRPEIYASGLRNPWRMSFDAETGDLWVGDVGQDTREEVDRVERGKNYGWRVMEGSLCRPGGPACDPSLYAPPALEYDHRVGRSITGGYVYRGTAIPALRGHYLYADYATRLLFAWDPATPPPSISDPQPLLVTPQGVVSFGEDARHELYLLDLESGLIRTLVARTGRPTVGPPETLSATGCLDLATRRPPPPAIAYTPRIPFWSDGAAKSRWVLLPEAGAIDPTPPERGAWAFPVGTLFIKHFDFQTNAGLRPLETRFLIQEADGVRGFTYRWNDAGTDATLVTTSLKAPIDTDDGPLTWHYPGPTDCTTCHRGRGVLGLDGYQLEPPAPLLARFSAPPAPATLHPLADAPVAARARAWLHVNCAYCHDGLGPSGTPLDLRRDLSLDAMAACDIPPLRGDLGLGPAARLIAPGSPDASVLWHRLASRAADGMPPLGTSRVDPDASLVSDWIATLNACR